jgi:trimethylamine--corrinoid protein Co-methyltransferase
MVIDNEICGLAKRIAEGIEVNEKTIALDLIKEVGPGGQFLGKKHTIEYFSKEHFLPILLDRNARSIWKSAGAKDLISRAKDYLKKKLQEYVPQKLEKDVQKELRKAMEEAKEKLLR